MRAYNCSGHQRIAVRSERPSRAGFALLDRHGSWRAVGPSMAHGCAAPSPAVGPAHASLLAPYIIFLLTAFFWLPVGNICLEKISELIILTSGVNQ